MPGSWTARYRWLVSAGSASQCAMLPQVRPGQLSHGPNPARIRCRIRCDSDKLLKATERMRLPERSGSRLEIPNIKIYGYYSELYLDH